MVASYLPKSSGETRGYSKPNFKAGYLLLHLIALGTLFIQLGCAGVDLNRSEERLRLPTKASAASRWSDLIAVEREQVLREPLPLPPSSPHDAPKTPEKTVVIEKSRGETGFDSSQRQIETVDEQVLEIGPKEQFAWKPHLLIRANDDVIPVGQVYDAQTADLKTMSAAPEILSPESNSSYTFDGFEYDLPIAGRQAAYEFRQERWRRVKSDYQNFYSQSSLFQLGAGFLVGAAMANTGFDKNFTHDIYRDNVIDIANEDISQTLHQPKVLGDGYIVLPALGVLAVSQPLLDRSEWTRPLGELGDRGARAILVGGPVVLITQNLTGASRPYESSSGSHWKPFQDNNGVSGHAFVGAVPFLAAAKMSRQPLAKAVWYGVSVLPAVSRVNDDRHYFSQVFLGWYIAWLSTNAVDNSIKFPRNLKIAPTLSPYGPGLMLEKQF